MNILGRLADRFKHNFGNPPADYYFANIYEHLIDWYSMSGSPKINSDGMLSGAGTMRRTLSLGGDPLQSFRQAESGQAKSESGSHTPPMGSARGTTTKRTPVSPFRGGSATSKPSRPRSPSPPGPLINFDSSKATEGQAVLQLLNAVMGAGIVGHPFCFRSCGLGLAFTLVLITVIAAEFSMHHLLLAAHISGKRSYEELARHSFGAVGQGLVNACITVMNLGSLVAYLNLVSDTFSLVAGTIVPPGAEPSRTAILSGITVCAALPLALYVRSPRVLASVSQASVGFLLLFAAVLLALGLGPSASTLGSLRWWRWEGALTAFPVIAYSFTAHQVKFAT